MSSTHRRARVAVGSAIVLTAIGASASAASAHISVVTYGTTATAGATNVIYFRVPHGCPEVDTTTYPVGAQTTKVEINIPVGTPGATGVKPEKKAGWDVAVVRDASKNVTKVTWTVRNTADALPDWTYGDFGIRATLNGVDGTKLQFPAVQTCGVHDDGTDATALGLHEDWAGADAPNVTLVSSDKAVTNAAALADLKASSTDLKTRVAALEKSWLDISGRIDAAMAALRWTGDAAASHSASGGLNVTADLASIHRWQKVNLVANGTKVGSARLNSAGDLAVTLSKAVGAQVPAGTQLDVVLGDKVMASTIAS